MGRQCGNHAQDSTKEVIRLDGTLLDAAEMGFVGFVSMPVH